MPCKTRKGITGSVGAVIDLPTRHLTKQDKSKQVNQCQNIRQDLAALTIAKTTKMLQRFLQLKAGLSDKDYDYARSKR